MKFEQIPEEKKEQPNNKDKKGWLVFTDKNGVKTNVTVFEGETEEQALERARAIDARLGDKSTF